MTLLRRLFLYLVASGTFAACEAGPSAFHRSTPVDEHPEDTADVTTLPAVPEAADVESGAPTLTGSDGAAAASEIHGAPDSALASTPDFVRAEGAPVFERPEHVRGIYLNAWAAGSRRRVDALVDLARGTEVNAFVIDIKDATGYVSHRTAVPLAREIGATGEIRIADLPGLLRRLSDEGIYPIARIVVVKDPLLSGAFPELAVQDTAGGVFVDGKGIVWLNPYDRRVWEYHVALAREVASLGFPEIQWDYVRFPDIPASERARVVYPQAGDTPKPRAIGDFLAHSRASLQDLGVQVTADVFGVTTSASRDVGIGQVWESFIGSVDVALPMVYPSHYWIGSFGYQAPNAHPYEVVKHALEDALRRSDAVEGAGRTRPWLQDFTLGTPRYEAPEVRAQIQAAYDAGVQEWVLWNPGSSYTPDALEPEGGFTEEPLIRIAERIVPVSERFAVMDSVRTARAAASATAPEPARDTAAGPGSAPDTTASPPGVGPAPADTLPSDTLAVATPADSLPSDTLAGAVPTDTLPSDTLGRSTPPDTLPRDTVRTVARPAIRR